MSIHYQDDLVTLHHGDALEVARTLEAGSVDCIVTSPPYFGLRDYGEPGQYGHESTPVEYVETMRALMAELSRILARDGTLWLNLGDSYGKRKQLLGIPWRVALALQDDGWILRNSIIWHKPNAMPESVKDRLSGRHENLFLFTKSPKYFFNLDGIREPHLTVGTHKKFERPRSERAKSGNDKLGPGVGGASMGFNPLGKNPGDVWAINNKPFKGAHFAAFPPEMVARCISAGCRPGGTVMDPFSGSGTTGMVAIEEGRNYVGIDINVEYLELSLATRLQGSGAA
jgi:site-specific DNA-methyltransferase (cytosine-N4-specific)